MLTDYFYHGILKTVTYGFGTLFNNIYVKKLNSNGDVSSTIKVPIRYGPTQKFLARLNQSPPDLNNPIEITLPRMSFELTTLSYDSSKKTTTTTSFLVPDENGNQIRKMYLSVPYTIGYNLYIMTKLTEDVWQIVEQILPYFTPSHSLTLNIVPGINEKRDIHFSLNSIDIQEDYEGDFSERVTFIYTLAFSADAMFFKPIVGGDGSIESNIVKNVSIGFLSGDPGNGVRDLTYTLGPKATNSYSNTVVSTLVNDVETNSITIDVANSTSINNGDYITIDNETLLVINKINNTLTVRRGEYGTPITNHVLGTEVKLITVSDNNLIPYGDEFGISNIEFN